MNELKRRVTNLLISLDQTLFCCLTFGDSNPDETPSAYAWRAEGLGKWQGRTFRPLIDWIFLRLFGQKDHCYKAWLSENKSEIWNGLNHE